MEEEVGDFLLFGQGRAWVAGRAGFFLEREEGVSGAGVVRVAGAGGRSGGGI